MTVTSYTDTKCTAGEQTAAYQFTIDAGVALTGPPPAARRASRTTTGPARRTSRSARTRTRGPRSATRSAAPSAPTAASPDRGRRASRTATSGFAGAAAVRARPLRRSSRGRWARRRRRPVLQPRGARRSVLRVKSPVRLPRARVFLDDRGPSYKLRGRLRRALGARQGEGRARQGQARQVPLRRQGEDARRRVQEALHRPQPRRLPRPLHVQGRRRGRGRARSSSASRSSAASSRRRRPVHRAARLAPSRAARPRASPGGLPDRRGSPGGPGSRPARRSPG